jgi:hypothetical protein
MAIHAPQCTPYKANSKQIPPQKRNEPMPPTTARQHPQTDNSFSAIERIYVNSFNDAERIYDLLRLNPSNCWYKTRQNNCHSA